MPRTFKKISVIKLGLLTFVVVLEAFILLKPQNFFSQPLKRPLEEYALEIVKKCATSDYHPGCYDKEIPKLMGKISMEEAFMLTRIVQEKDSSFSYCHVLGHKLASIETEKNPSDWMKVLSRCPANGMCANGCLHGAMQERFKAESLTDEQVKSVVPDLRKGCSKRKDWNPTSLDQAICYHGLGHLTMYITKADFKKSIQLCDDIAKLPGGDFSSLCYEGLFMQLFQPLEVEDEALVKGKQPTKTGLLSFCKGFGVPEQQEACYIEGWPLYKTEVDSASGIVDFCNKNPRPSTIGHCFDMLFHILGQGKNFEVSAITEICKDIPASRRGQCFASSAMSMIDADLKFIPQSVELCKQSEKYGASAECYKQLAGFSNYNFHNGSKEQNYFCSLLPSSYQSNCLAK